MRLVSDILTAGKAPHGEALIFLQGRQVRGRRSEGGVCEDELDYHGLTR